MVSIIIPHLKNKEIIYECIDSIEKKIGDVNYEIIIVNNNSIDHSLDTIEKEFINISIIHSKINKGYAGGCNLGAKHAKEEYLLFLNNDTIIDSNSILELINTIKDDNLISSVQPKIKNYYNKEFFDYAGGAGGYMDYLVYPYARGRILNTLEEDIGQYDTKKKIFWASGTAFLTKASIFKEIGGFDETLFAHMEEIDYHWKCQLNGYKIYINPKSVIYHKGGQTLKYGSYKKIFLNHRNSLILLLTNYKKFSLIRYTKRLSLEIVAFIYYLLFLKFSAASAVLMANIWIFINIAYLIKRKKDNDRYNNNQPLISNYSIIKKYYLNNKKKYSQLNN
jgi:GT2 family glycosyltransferase